jgi:predicted MFS family arabinose efflux permease
MMSSTTEATSALPPLTRGQWLLLFVLAAVQFTHVLDFMIIMPLAPQLQKDLGLTIRDFSLIVSVYGFAAAIAGFALAPLLDRFDRKHTLLSLYAGFTLGTLMCAVAPNYLALLGARILTGAFGGVAAATVLAIVGDAFPPARRGTAMGVVMSAFSIASIAGLPTGIYLAETISFSGNGADGWRVPFAVLGVFSALLLLLASRFMSSVREHLAGEEERASLWEVLSRPNHVSAYALMVMLVMSTFVVGPFLATFLVNNVGRSQSDVGLVYLFGGAATLLTTNLSGRLTDRFARLPVFRVFALLALLSILILAHLPANTSLWLTLTATTAMMVLTSARMVPAMAMITSSSEPHLRGSFLSVNGSVQQLAIGVAPLLAGFILGDSKEGQPLTHFGLVGFLGAAAGLASIALAGWLRPAAGQAGEPVGDEPLTILEAPLVEDASPRHLCQGKSA